MRSASFNPPCVVTAEASAPVDIVFARAAAEANESPLFFAADSMPPGVAALAAPRRVQLTSPPTLACAIEHRKACVNAAPPCSATTPRIVSARRADVRANAYIVDALRPVARRASSSSSSSSGAIENVRSNLMP
jgi:hypothetical protein